MSHEEKHMLLSVPLFYAFVDNFASDKKGNQKDE